MAEQDTKEFRVVRTPNHDNGVHIRNIKIDADSMAMINRRSDFDRTFEDYRTLTKKGIELVHTLEDFERSVFMILDVAGDTDHHAWDAPAANNANQALHQSDSDEYDRSGADYASVKECPAFRRLGGYIANGDDWNAVTNGRREYREYHGRVMHDLQNERRELMKQALTIATDIIEIMPEDCVIVLVVEGGVKYAMCVTVPQTAGAIGWVSLANA